MSQSKAFVPTLSRAQAELWIMRFHKSLMCWNISCRTLLSCGEKKTTWRTLSSTERQSPLDLISLSLKKSENSHHHYHMFQVGLWILTPSAAFNSCWTHCGASWTIRQHQHTLQNACPVVMSLLGISTEIKVTTIHTHSWAHLKHMHHKHLVSISYPLFLSLTSHGLFDRIQLCWLTGRRLVCQ